MFNPVLPVKIKFNEDLCCVNVTLLAMDFCNFLEFEPSAFL